MRIHIPAQKYSFGPNPKSISSCHFIFLFASAEDIGFRGVE